MTITASKSTKIVQPEQVIPAVTEEVVTLTLPLEVAQTLRDTLGTTLGTINDELWPGLHEALSNVTGYNFDYRTGPTYGKFEIKRRNHY